MAVEPSVLVPPGVAVGVGVDVGPPGVAVAVGVGVAGTPDAGRLTHDATDGTPFESTMNSMYEPAGATFAFDGICTFRPPLVCENDSGT
jgi:hypothetical protein